MNGVEKQNKQDVYCVVGVIRISSFNTRIWPGYVGIILFASNDISFVSEKVQR